MKYRVVPMTIDQPNDGIDTAVAHIRHAYPDESVDFWAVQEKDGGRWYTVDDFESMEDAEEFLNQLIEGDDE